jgi:phosphate starvation-inducible PhoH-like protein
MSKRNSKPRPRSQAPRNSKSRAEAPKQDLVDQRFRPKNQAQQKAWDTIKNNLITFLVGPVGTAKTHIATAYAIQASKLKQYEKIVLTRPLVEAHEHLGWLPGEIKDKVAPFMEPIDNCATKIGKGHIEIITKPLAYMRGVTFEDSIHILDEAQNCTYKQLKLYLSRFGNGSKIIICGDTTQADIPDSGLQSILENLKGLTGIGVFTFTLKDIVRHKLVSAMMERFDAADKKNFEQKKQCRQ